MDPSTSLPALMVCGDVARPRPDGRLLDHRRSTRRQARRGLPVCRPRGSGRGAAALTVRQAEAEVRSPVQRSSTRLVVRETRSDPLHRADVACRAMRERGVQRSRSGRPLLCLCRSPGPGRRRHEQSLRGRAESRCFDVQAVITPPRGWGLVSAVRLGLQAVRLGLWCPDLRQVGRTSTKRTRRP